MYQIFPDEVLGSGQFGIVYGGNVSLVNCRGVAASCFILKFCPLVSCLFSDFCSYILDFMLLQFWPPDYQLIIKAPFCLHAASLTSYLSAVLE